MIKKMIMETKTQELIIIKYAGTEEKLIPTLIVIGKQINRGI